MNTIEMFLPSATPRYIARRIDFWWNNLGLLSAIGIGLVLFCAFWVSGYLTPPRTSSVAKDPVSWTVTGVLVLMLFWGIIQAVLLAAKLEIEAACVHYLGSKTDEEEGNQLTHEQIKNLLPENSHSVSVRLFRHIWMAAKIDQFESTSVALQPYRETLVVQQQAVSDLQKMSLHLGILGTFVGLVIAFLGLGDNSSSGGVDSFQLISRALQFGFSTSVFGLFSSLLLGVLVHQIEKKRTTFFAFLERVADDFLLLVCRAKNEDPVLEHKYEMLRAHIAALDVRVNEQTKTIAEGLEKLANTRHRFEDILAGVGKREEAFLAEIRGAYDFFSPKVISGNLHQSLAATVKNITDNLQEHLHGTLERYTEVNTGLVAMRDQFAAFDGQLRTHAEASAEAVSTSKQEIFAALNKVAEAQKQFTEHFNSQRIKTGIEKSIREAGDQVTSEYVAALREMMPHLQALSGNLSEFNRKAYAEIRQRDTWQLLKGIGQNAGELFMRLIRAFLALFSTKK